MEVIKYLYSQTFDLILLLDVKCSDLNGLNFLKELRNNNIFNTNYFYNIPKYG